MFQTVQKIAAGDNSEEVNPTSALPVRTAMGEGGVEACEHATAIAFEN